MTQHDLEDCLEAGIIGLVLLVLLSPVWLPMLIYNALTKEA